VDGFNLYYGALKNTPYRWLDLVALSRQLLPPADTVERVKYFTARVSGSADPDAPRRQHAYLSALSTLANVEVHYGSFLAKTVWRPIVNFPVAGAVIHSATPVSLPAGIHDVDGGSFTTVSKLIVDSYSAKRPPKPRDKKRKSSRPMADALVTEVHTMEEKGTDVTLAAHLINDAWKGVYDAAAVISNDTDLVTPIQIVSVERKLPVYIICPGRWSTAPALAKVANYQRNIRPGMLAAAQLPDPIPGTTIQKPKGW
jgi:hypothetical protein